MAFEAYIYLIINVHIINLWGARITKLFFPYKYIILKSMQTYHEPLHNVIDSTFQNRTLHIRELHFSFLLIYHYVPYAIHTPTLTRMSF